MAARRPPVTEQQALDGDDDRPLPSTHTPGWHSSALPPPPPPSAPRQQRPNRSSSPWHPSSASSSFSSATSSSAAASTADAANLPPATSSPKYSTPVRLRNPSSSHMPSWRLESDVDITDDWLDDTPDSVSFVTPEEPSHDSTTLDDEFVSALAENDYSSPSSYPSFLSPDQASDQQQQQQPPPRASAPDLGSHASRSFALAGLVNNTPSRSTARSALPPLANSLGHRPSPIGSAPYAAAEMPPYSHDELPQPKRRRLSTAGALNRLILPLPSDDDDLFGDKLEDAPASDGLTTIDLTEANEVPEELKKPPVDNRIKISAFQCAICMDDVTTLTVTHCGHLYCQQCLHSSLHVDSTRGKCPMCRAKIDMKSRGSYTSKTKGFWPLELKLMTTNKKGKRKADAKP